MIADMHIQTINHGLQRLQAWIDDGQLWVHLHSDAPRKIFFVGENPDVQTIADELAKVYSVELGNIVTFFRHGSSLQLILALHRYKTESPD